MTSKNLSDFLGKEHFNYLMANKKDEIGISRGLACADSFITSPNCPVSISSPLPGITLTSICSVSPPTCVQASPREITLRGRVLPIGGLKEKLLAAKYDKIKEVLVPAENKPDIQELDKEITDGHTITFVSSMKEVLNKALV